MFYRLNKWTWVRLTAAPLQELCVLGACDSCGLPRLSIWDLIFNSVKQVEVFMICGQAQSSKSRNWKLWHSFPASWGHCFSSSLLHGWANRFPPTKRWILTGTRTFVKHRIVFERFKFAFVCEASREIKEESRPVRSSLASLSEQVIYISKAGIFKTLFIPYDEHLQRFSVNLI